MIQTTMDKIKIWYQEIVKGDKKEVEIVSEWMEWIMSDPTKSGTSLMENPVDVKTLHPSQRRLLEMGFVDPLSDMVDHVPYYTQEECDIIELIVITLRDLTATEIRDTSLIDNFMSIVFPESYMDHQIKSGCVWDPRKRDTQIQFRFRLSSALPTRLVMVPLQKIFSSLELVARHVGKPFQSFHLTSKDINTLKSYLSTCDVFTVSIWIGSVDKKIVETGTGFRTRDFIGSGSSLDTNLRILFRRGLKGEAFVSALKDFVECLSIDQGDEKKMVPVLLQRQDFINLHDFSSSSS